MAQQKTKKYKSTLWNISHKILKIPRRMNNSKEIFYQEIQNNDKQYIIAIESKSGKQVQFIIGIYFKQDSKQIILLKESKRYMKIWKFSYSEIYFRW